MSKYPVTRFLLSERTNPHSRLRTNGVRFWGYPSRKGNVKPRVIVAHTTESDLGTPALNVARWQATAATAPSSYHVIVDSRTIVRTLADEAVAFHAVGQNTHALGLSFATRAHLWGRNPKVDEQMIARGAQVAREWVKRYGIPVRWISLAEAKAGKAGFLRHSDADPGRRGDPGKGFPAKRFFALIEEEEDEMKPEERKMLEETHRMLGDLTNAITEGRLGGRNVADDLRRTRLDLRAIGRKLCLPIRIEGEEGEEGHAISS